MIAGLGMKAQCWKETSIKRKSFCQDQKEGRLRIRARRKTKPMWVPLERTSEGVTESENILGERGAKFSSKIDSVHRISYNP